VLKKIKWGILDHVASCVSRSEHLKAGIVEPEVSDVTRQRLGKHISAETNTHATMEELLDAVFLCSPCRIKYSTGNERKVGD
jgi:hypothetical protein